MKGRIHVPPMPPLVFDVTATATYGLVTLRALVDGDTIEIPLTLKELGGLVDMVASIAPPKLWPDVELTPILLIDHGD